MTSAATEKEILFFQDLKAVPKIKTIHDAAKISSCLYCPVIVGAFKEVAEARAEGWNLEKEAITKFDPQLAKLARHEVGVHASLLVQVSEIAKARQLYETLKKIKTSSVILMNCAVEGEERRIQAKLVSISNGIPEAPVPIGSIDVLTQKSIIEIKVSSQWKSGLGQLLAYSTFYPDRKKYLYLFEGTLTILKDKVKRKHIEAICANFDVELVCEIL